MKTLAVCAIFLVIQQCLAQSGFIVRVFQYTPPSFDTATHRCFGTIISPSHILAPASCVIVPSSMSIGIQTDLGGSLPGGGWSSSYKSGAKMVFIHPSYESSQERAHNVAVIHIPEQWASAEFFPRTIGSLQSNSTDCNLYGWGETVGIVPDRTQVAVYGSQYCDATSQQVFCSAFASNTTAPCTARLGSPVTCGEGSAVAGFLISDRNCTVIGNRYLAYYHSVGEFREWIEQVSRADVATKISAALILSAALSLRNFV